MTDQLTVPSPAPSPSPHGSYLSELRTDLDRHVSAGRMTAQQAEAAMAEARGEDPASTVPSWAKQPTSEPVPSNVKLTPPAAEAELARLVKDRDFVTKFARGDAEARQRMEHLHQQAYPGKIDETGATDPATAPLPLAFAADVPAEQQAQLHGLAEQTITSLGVDRSLVADAVTMIETAGGARQWRPMDRAEIQAEVSLLRQRWGDSFDENSETIGRFMEKAGPGGEWFCRSLLRAGPQVAARGMEMLLAVAKKAR